MTLFDRLFSGLFSSQIDRATIDGEDGDDRNEEGKNEILLEGIITDRLGGGVGWWGLLSVKCLLLFTTLHFNGK